MKVLFSKYTAKPAPPKPLSMLSTLMVTGTFESPRAPVASGMKTVVGTSLSSKRSTASVGRWRGLTRVCRRLLAVPVPLDNLTRLRNQEGNMMQLAVES